MTTTAPITLEAPDPAPVRRFVTALGVDAHVGVRASDAPSTGFRGFALSLVLPGPGTVDRLVAAALDHGGSVVKPVTRGFWGYGGSVSAPDGTIWTFATSARRDDGPADRGVDALVLLLGVADVRASKRSYLDRGLTLRRSFGGKYAEFAGPVPGVTLALYGRRALAKQAGVVTEGTGSHRLVLGWAPGPFTDPDGFRWEAAARPAGARIA